MTLKEHQKLAKTYIENIKRYMQEAGGLFPHLTIFAKKLETTAYDEGHSLIHIPIPPKYIESDENKDLLVEDILPTIFDKLKESFTPYGVAWASEAWMRIAKNEEEFKKGYKDLPIKKEVLMVTIETDHKSESIIYDINRTGQQINSDGELTDKISLRKSKELNSPTATTSGRFVGLYSKLKA